MDRQTPTTRVGFQMYSLYGAADPLSTLVREVAAAGYQGVEFADRLHDADTNAVRAALTETGVEPIAGHVSLDSLESHPNEILDLFSAIDCYRLVIPHIPGSHFLTRTRVNAIANRLGDIADLLTDHGFELLVHTTRDMHEPMLDRVRLAGLVSATPVPVFVWEQANRVLATMTPARFRSETAFERLVDQTESHGISFEIDTKAVVTADRDIETVLELVGGRVQAVHLSNATRSRRFPPAYRPSGVGDGVVDLEAAARAVIEREIDWLIAESEDDSESLSDATAVLERVFTSVMGAAEEPSTGTGKSLGFGRELVTGV